MKKHLGILKNTGVRIAVVFREMPDDAEHCLVAEIDRMPDRYHDAMYELINSTAAQKVNDLYEVLHKRNFPDGNNALAGLHSNKLMRKVPVDDVEMTVQPHAKVPLRMINDQIRSSQPGAAPATEAKPETVADNPADDARRLMVKAELINQEAEALLDQARALAPELFTKERGRPKKTEAERAKTKADEKVKRKERDTDKRTDAQEAELNRQVADKLQRDAAPDVNKPDHLV
jgi:hypothetical protein